MDRHNANEFGQVGRSGLTGTIDVHDQRFYRSVVLGGSLGAAEAYLRGWWSSTDLVKTMRVLAQNFDTLKNMDRGVARVMRPLRAGLNWLSRNTRNGSRRNIAAHYDLSNDFFALMLDPTMTYSGGVFPAPESTLEDASLEKYDRICRKLELSRRDRILEIGTGWGGFAEHAAKNYGCHVTTTTISGAQHAYAQQRFRNAGLSQRITLLQDDYRELSGKYDKLVSIEMIEAVGEKFLPGYFAKCSELLVPHGMMALQSIIIPDHRYNAYRKSVDFIQRYIFPGGFLPSLAAITDCLGRRTDFRMVHEEDFSSHYAETLTRWRKNFWDRINEVRHLGFDERFIRTWHYYLCYCEAGFRERQIGVVQLLLTKPSCRRSPILAGV
ncbi:MAG: class I SAM-dependent methyltransferase [Planctomycetales bacterium]|nr:class I SAM-dependent methyltransferase [Planctomycetales bacterium]